MTWIVAPSPRIGATQHGVDRDAADCRDKERQSWIHDSGLSFPQPHLGLVREPVRLTTVIGIDLDTQEPFEEILP